MKVNGTPGSSQLCNRHPSALCPPAGSHLDIMYSTLMWGNHTSAAIKLQSSTYDISITCNLWLIHQQLSASSAPVTNHYHLIAVTDMQYLLKTVSVTYSCWWKRTHPSTFIKPADINQNTAVITWPISCSYQTVLQMCEESDVNDDSHRTRRTSILWSKKPTPPQQRKRNIVTL